MHIKDVLFDRYENALRTAAVLEERNARGSRESASLIAQVERLKKDAEKTAELVDAAPALRELYETAVALSAALSLQAKYNTQARRRAVITATIAMNKAMANISLDFVIPF